MSTGGGAFGGGGGDGDGGGGDGGGGGGADGVFAVGEGVAVEDGGAVDEDGGDAAAGELEARDGDVVDAPVAVDFAHGAADRLDRAAHPLHHVDVMDRVFEQRAAATPSGIDAPRRSVVALDRDELVIAERHRQQAAGAIVGQQ